MCESTQLLRVSSRYQIGIGTVDCELHEHLNTLQWQYQRFQFMVITFRYIRPDPGANDERSLRNDIAAYGFQGNINRNGSNAVRI